MVSSAMIQSNFVMTQRVHVGLNKIYFIFNNTLTTQQLGHAASKNTYIGYILHLLSCHKECIPCRLQAVDTSCLLLKQDVCILLLQHIDVLFLLLQQ